eukprot:gene23353-30605_t
MRTRLQDLPSSRPCVAIAPHARLALHRYPEQSRLAGPCQPVFQPGNRSLAARSSKDDKSWSQLLGDAADLAKTAVSKVTQSIQSVLAPKSGGMSSILTISHLFLFCFLLPFKVTQSIQSVLAPKSGDTSSILTISHLFLFFFLLPFQVTNSIQSVLAPKSGDTSSPGKMTRSEDKTGLPTDFDRQLPAMFGGGIVGRLMGGLVGGLVKQVGKEVQVSSMPMSQSVSSMSLNGVRTQQISIVLPVSGATGQTAVDSSRDAKGRRDTKILVQMPGGDVMMVNDGDSGDQGGAGGRTIDVDYTEIK